MSEKSTLSSLANYYGGPLWKGLFIIAYSLGAHVQGVFRQVSSLRVRSWAVPNKALLNQWTVCKWYWMKGNQKTRTPNCLDGHTADRHYHFLPTVGIVSIADDCCCYNAFIPTTHHCVHATAWWLCIRQTLLHCIQPDSGGLSCRHRDSTETRPPPRDHDHRVHNLHHDRNVVRDCAT